MSLRLNMDQRIPMLSRRRLRRSSRYPLPVVLVLASAVYALYHLITSGTLSSRFQPSASPLVLIITTPQGIVQDELSDVEPEPGVAEFRPPPTPWREPEPYVPGRFSEKGYWLRDLGPTAQESYRRVGLTDPQEYQLTLVRFINSVPSHLRPSLFSGLSTYLPTPRSQADHPPLPEMLSYRTIHQTDRSLTRTSPHPRHLWRTMHPGWKQRFYDDDQLEEWMRRKLAGRVESESKGLEEERSLERTWGLLSGVKKADFWRYLVLLLEGGVYSDVDTHPLTKIESWGTHSPRLHDISSTDGPHWLPSVLATKPSVVLGIEVDIHSLEHWADDHRRPLMVCQWTMASTPGHPVFLDAVRRVVEATVGGEGELLEVLEHTGPAMFTDAVLTYLKARYGVVWEDLRGLERPLRIGEILILPTTGFSPNSLSDFHAGLEDDEQAAVMHYFRGSWKRSEEKKWAARKA